jgi:hypothetical protein
LLIFVAPAPPREDNEAMNKQSDFLPWIFGGLSIFAVAIAIALVSASRGTAPPTLAAQPPPAALQAQLPASQAPSPVLQAPPAPEPVASMAASSAAPPALASQSLTPDPALQSEPQPTPQPAAQPPVEPGQIWECMTNGLKTFSNNPCGPNSTLVEVRAINTMHAPPPVRYAQAYPTQPAYSPQQGSSPQYADQNSYSDEDSDSDQDAGYAAGNSAVIGGFAVLPRRINQHPHRPHPHHNPGPPPRRN